MNVHRILNRAAWCPRTDSRILFELIIDAFVPHGPVMLKLDDTIERRRGRWFRAKDICCDSVRSSDSHFIKVSGIRWMGLMVLIPIPGRADLGCAVPHRGGAVRACLPRAGPPAQAAARRRANPSSRPPAGCRGATSCWLATAGSRPYCSSTLCVTTASLRSPACGAMRRSTSPPRCGCPARSDARGPRKRGCIRSPRPSRPRRRASHQLTVPGCYGVGTRVIEIASATAAWGHGGLSVVSIRSRARPRFQGARRTSGPALHRPRPPVRADRVLVRAPLERRSYLPRSPPPPRRRDVSGSGPTRQSPAQWSACLACSPSSRFWLHGSRPANGNEAPSAGRHGRACTRTRFTAC